MTRLPRITGRELVRALESAGFLVDRTRGSHHFLKHPDGRATAVPSIPANPLALACCEPSCATWSYLSTNWRTCFKWRVPRAGVTHRRMGIPSYGLAKGASPAAGRSLFLDIRATRRTIRSLSHNASTTPICQFSLFSSPFITALHNALRDENCAPLFSSSSTARIAYSLLFIDSV